MRFVYSGLFSICIAAAFTGCEEKNSDDRIARAPRTPEKIADPHLTNAFKFTDKVWGGGEPHGEEAFKTLKEIGVKTIISVDGAKPDVEMAKKYGMKYVHLPIGYDGVPEEKAREIAKAMNEMPGPVFVHCHHGKHRSPAALATACVVNGTLTNDEAAAAMKAAGTGANYLGLWESARSAKPADRRELKSMKVKFVERAKIPAMAEAMVGIDDVFSHLQLCKAAGWQQPKDHPDLAPAHETLKLRELFTEMMRHEEYSAKPDDFKKWTEASERDLLSLESQLKITKTPDTAQLKEMDAAYTRVEASCKDCHGKYRNVPQRAKK